jgi:hypothetical protein
MACSNLRGDCLIASSTFAILVDIWAVIMFVVLLTRTHQQRTDFRFSTLVLVRIGLDANVSISPGSNFFGRRKTTKTKRSTLVPVGVTTQTKELWPFSPGWCYDAGLKVLWRVTSKGKHPIQTHMCCVGGVERYVRDNTWVLVLNPMRHKGEKYYFFSLRGPLVRV